ncbi:MULTISPECIES: peptidase domain-containing ABC transporter [unclassified Janthinobacterium]|uniref:peptidase domain-containing ABC transporter n=1 Tax=unclassified Janthinobacterium TaxID=2610881 RepID=UPI000348909F|nr:MULTISPECIES: peptidase domain-containing ABC transporter [unclassified Janthinobacterium]MEC5162764.1 ATP-binding cassette subfamily B protein RaxB [Janthinobacterium sp. CG_S6]
MSGAGFALPRLHFGFGQRLPLVLQGEAAECGLACLAMVAGYHGYRTDLLSLRRRFTVGLRGSTLKGVMDIASALALSSRPIRIELGDLPQLPTPCLLHWNLNHFVVLKKVLRKGGGAPAGIVVHDPARGQLTLSMAEVSASFTGVVLELTPTPGFRREEDKQRISLRQMMGSATGLKRSLAQIFVLALALEAFALVGPFFMQLVVDGAILSADRDLLTMLALGFGLLMLVQTALSVFRSWMVLYLSTHLNLQWLANVFTHLIRLPMHYFEKRHLGDVVSRFGAVQAIQRTLSANFVEAILDGLLALATLAMLLAYSPALSAVVLAALLLYAALRCAFYRPYRAASEEQINLQAREQSLFLESIRGIQAIKLFNHQDERRARWLNALGAATNRHIATQRMTLGFNSAHTLLAGAENILIVFLGARLVMDNVFSVGMLYAFISYKTTFTGRVYSLIDKWLELKMLSLQGERLADIVLSAPEEAGAAAEPGQRREPADTSIEVRGLWFRYSDIEPWVLSELSLTIRAGESLALVGPSGCGKTTLLKLLLGLLEPSRGEILVGGVPLAQLGARRYRALIGAVMQDDQLLSGSIAENISFFDLQVDLPWLQQCIAAAALAEEIAAMPMGSQTLIGDMGTSLSGGQKQRLLLARALYKRPRILFLDEATSHLDGAREQAVNQAINALSLTRVIVAHRAETIRSAARVVELDKGAVVRDLRQAEREAQAQA